MFDSVRYLAFLSHLTSCVWQELRKGFARSLWAALLGVYGRSPAQMFKYLLLQDASLESSQTALTSWVSHNMLTLRLRHTVRCIYQTLNFRDYELSNDQKSCLEDFIEFFRRENRNTHDTLYTKREMIWCAWVRLCRKCMKKDTQ